MIRYKLRQEKQGGYLLDLRQGKATHLTQPVFERIQQIHATEQAAPGGVPNDLQRWGQEYPAEGWQSLAHLDVLTPSGLRDLQVIPLADPVDAVPDDCLSAPARIYFELTRRCNLACRTCFNESHLPLQDELTNPEILEALQQMNRLGTFEIRFTGGEPTTHPDLQQILAYAKSLGFYVSLGTNGVYDEAVRDWIYACGVDWFILSLDGDELRNDQVRGRGTYQQVRRTLGEMGVRGCRVRLNMVVARHNIGAIESVARLADEYGVESLNLIPLRPYGRSTLSMLTEMFDQQDFYAFIHHIHGLRKRYRIQFTTTLDLLDPEETTSHDAIVQKKQTCAAGVEAAVVGATGDVYGCSYSPASFPNSPDLTGRRLFVAGNLRQDSLRSIWRDSSRWAVFRQLAVYKHPRCLACEHYGARCVGSCPIMGYYHQGQPDSFDPYCFVDLLKTSSTT